MLIWFAMVNIYIYIYIYMIIERYYYGDPGVDPKVVINYGDETIMCWQGILPQSGTGAWTSRVNPHIEFFSS